MINHLLRIAFKCRRMCGKHHLWLWLPTDILSLHRQMSFPWLQENISIFRYVVPSGARDRRDVPVAVGIVGEIFPFVSAELFSGAKRKHVWLLQCVRIHNIYFNVNETLAISFDASLCITPTAYEAGNYVRADSARQTTFQKYREPTSIVGDARGCYLR